MTEKIKRQILVVRDTGETNMLDTRMVARNREDDIDIMRTLRECGVQLVSASESIDESPEGMLLHGIMSSIAEFYSQNLANEVKKGLHEKVRSGGTVSKAPIGYINIRQIDDKGREERTVVLDEERAPLIKLAFEEFATGNWTVNSLADHLATCGLTTRATPKIPATPIDKSALNQILKNPYYKGTIVYKGVEYAGNHHPLVAPTVWQQVQDVLAPHVNGERTREHPHFLKGSLFCRNCGSRMIVTYARSSSGIRYPYFVCAGRHNKVKDCKQKAVLIDAVEEQVQQIYNSYSFPSQIRVFLEGWLNKRLKVEQEKFTAELDVLHREKDKLERKSRKLLEAHYNDAIPLDLMKSEQQKITKQLEIIKHQIATQDNAVSALSSQLKRAFDLIEDCGALYYLAEDHIKKLLNQVIFSKLWIERDGHITAKFAEPFQTLIEPIRNEITLYNKEKTCSTEVPADFFSVIVKHLSNFFGNCLNNDFLVEISGIEPLTS